MQIAIVGLAGCGKTTVFNTLTRGHAETGGYGGLSSTSGVVKVPDERLDRLAEIFKPKKIVHADVTYVDLPAPPPRPRATSGPRSCRPSISPGCATRTRCSTSCARSRTPRAAAPGGLGRPGARPRAPRPRVHPRRPRDGRSPPRAAPGERAATARRPSARRTSARRSILRAPQARARGRPPDPRRRRSTTTRRRRSAASGSSPRSRCSCCSTSARATSRARPALVGGIARRLRPPARDGRRAVGEDRDGARRARARRGRRCSWRSWGSPSRALDRVIAPVLPAARADLVPHRRPRRGPRVADPRRLDRRRRRGRDPHRPRARASSAPRRRLRGPAHARLDGRGAKARPAPLGGQDLPGRATATCVEILFSR